LALIENEYLEASQSASPGTPTCSDGHRGNPVGAFL
jgi:hypothetical protein